MIKIDYRQKLKRIKPDLDNSNNTWYISDSRPQIEIDLSNIQKEYFNENNPQKKHDLWQQMFLLVQKYARSLVLKKKKGGKYTDPDVIEDQANQVAITFMGQYLYRQNFYVGVSFAGMMNGKVLEACYKQLPDDDNCSLNETIGSDTDHEFEDLQGSETMTPLFREFDLPEDALQKVSMKETIFKLFKEFDSECYSESIKIKLRFYIYILLRRPRNKHIFPVFFKYVCNKQELDLIQLFELELFNRLKSSIED